MWRIYSNPDPHGTVMKCHSNFTSREMQDLCQSQEAKEKSLTTLLPVFANGIVYRNRYCAVCNFVSESHIIPFQGQVACPSNTGVYATSIVSLLQTLESEKRCNIFYYNPKNVNAIWSNGCNASAGFIRECNVTGEWDYYDPDVEQACLSYTHVYKTFYRNVFCYMCNNATNPLMRCSEIIGGDDNGLRKGSFTALLRFSEEIQDETVDNPETQPCRKGEIFDIIQVKRPCYNYLIFLSV
jgi:hypothetical protein